MKHDPHDDKDGQVSARDAAIEKDEAWFALEKILKTASPFGIRSIVDCYPHDLAEAFARALGAAKYANIRILVEGKEKAEAERDSARKIKAVFEAASIGERERADKAEAEASALKAQVAVLVDALDAIEDAWSEKITMPVWGAGGSVLCGNCAGRIHPLPNGHKDGCPLHVLNDLPASARAYSEERGRLEARHQDLSDAIHSYMTGMGAKYPNETRQETESRQWRQLSDAVGKFANQSRAYSTIRTPDKAQEHEG